MLLTFKGDTLPPNELPPGNITLNDDDSVTVSCNDTDAFLKWLFSQKPEFREPLLAILIEEMERNVL